MGTYKEKKFANGPDGKYPLHEGGHLVIVDSYEDPKKIMIAKMPAIRFRKGGRMGKPMISTPSFKRILSANDRGKDGYYMLSSRRTYSEDYQKKLVEKSFEKAAINDTSRKLGLEAYDIFWLDKDDNNGRTDDKEYNREQYTVMRDALMLIRNPEEIGNTLEKHLEAHPEIAKKYDPKFIEIDYLLEDDGEYWKKCLWDGIEEYLDKLPALLKKHSDKINQKTFKQ